MLKLLAWIEMVVSAMLLAVAAWPFSGYCSGRFMGLDCESLAIFGINMFVPLGFLGMICAAWFFKTKSVTSQYFLLFGFALIMFYWLLNIL